MLYPVFPASPGATWHAPREVLRIRVVHEGSDLFIKACETSKCSQIMILLGSVLTCFVLAEEEDWTPLQFQSLMQGCV